MWRAPAPGRPWTGPGPTGPIHLNVPLEGRRDPTEVPAGWATPPYALPNAATQAEPLATVARPVFDVDALVQRWDDEHDLAGRR